MKHIQYQNQFFLGNITTNDDGTVTISDAIEVGHTLVDSDVEEYIQRQNDGVLTTVTIHGDAAYVIKEMKPEIADRFTLYQGIMDRVKGRAEKVYQNYRFRKELNKLDGMGRK